ncbi:hypothetical protein HDE_07291 [Halotydeus destructor]|nr:hypothetical protein HDE_07291 [Halotydeus destructor]
MLPANGSKELKSPYFVVAFDVCNRADTLIYNLQAEGDGLTFDIMKSDDNIYRKGNSIVLLRAITDPWKEMTVDILVTGSSNGTDIKSQGGLSIRVKVDDSYCKKNGDFNCTPAVVTLSSLLLIASTGLAVCLIILLRRRNLTILSLEENKSDAHSDRQSLSNGISIENVIETNNSDHDSMSRASTESMQYPRKSSLKTVRSLAELFVDADQDGSEEGSYNNGGYEDTPGYPDVLKVEGGPGLGAEEPRRKSVVTFAETAQVRIMDTK